MKVTRALISVSNKDGIVELAKSLRKKKVEIISTGGTAALLEKNNVKVMSVSDYTGFPEILDGRVKTLHPKIYGGLLAKQTDESQVAKLKEFGISEINMVVVNLYPFEEVAAKPDCTLDNAIENIDIGGVSLIRAASKNYKDVVVVTDIKDYSLVLEEMSKNDGKVSEETRMRLAVKALATTSHYDRHISNFLYKQTLDQKEAYNQFPPLFHLRYRKIKDLRYGENPHQQGAFYIDESVHEASVGRAHQLWGKELSFNNIFDLNAALEIAKEFEEPICVIVKHANPCGVGRAKRDIRKAYQRALECDPISAFGGIIVLNREVTESLATEMSERFIEAILAPSFDEKALAILKKKKNIRLLILHNMNEDESAPESLDYKKVTGGLLIQDRDLEDINPKKWEIATGGKITEAQQDAALFAWKVVKHVKSNAIVIANQERTLGIGAGQMSRVEAVNIALEKAGPKIKNAALASDAFFPFDDSIKLLDKKAISTVIQPGGSMRDDDVVKAAKERKIAMVFTKMRHFLH